MIMTIKTFTSLKKFLALHYICCHVLVFIRQKLFVTYVFSNNIKNFTRDKKILAD